VNSVSQLRLNFVTKNPLHPATSLLRILPLLAAPPPMPSSPIPALSAAPDRYLRRR